MHAAPIDAAPTITDPLTYTTEDAQRLRELQRALAICRLCAHDARTLTDLARRMRLSPRTVRHYLAALQGVGVDVVVRHTGRAATYQVDARAWHGLLHVPAY